MGLTLRKPKQKTRYYISLHVAGKPFRWYAICPYEGWKWVKTKHKATCFFSPEQAEHEAQLSSMSWKHTYWIEAG